PTRLRRPASTFAQFGAGTFRPGVRTHLSRFVVVDPVALSPEADHLAAVGIADAFDRLSVDEAALVATPYHRAANRARPGPGGRPARVVRPRGG
ncbi:MAG TPA: adenylosuccinate synthetase, partial [Micromonosporaceae bacterium]|nr:adenylosuccinate synthetase [Micromonosporaceae bacterium]